MPVPYRSTPLETLDELYSIYGAETNHSDIPFLSKLNSEIQTLKDIIKDSDSGKHGIVLSIEGTWGSGKTSFVKLLCKAIENLNVAIVHYDSLYYGNVSEATDIFVKDIFEEVQERFGVKLQDGGSLAQNITPKLELTESLIPKLSVDFGGSRQPTERILSSHLNEKLIKLSGKMIVVIDDIDRASANDVVHFLRLVRVLKELPNFIIILPIDRLMLEEMLRSQNIANPRDYLNKVIDDSTDISPEQGSSKDLFFKLLNRKYHTTIHNGVLNLTWDLFLWETCLLIARQYEVNSQGSRFSMSIQPTDGSWQMVDALNSPDGQNFVRKFFEMTSRTYGAPSNYVFRVKNLDDPNADEFKHYQTMFGGMTFTDLAYSKFFPNLGPRQRFEDGGGRSMLTLKWWDDEAGIAARSGGSKDFEYRLRIPTDEPQRTAYLSEVNNEARNFWDIVRPIVPGNLPEKAIRYLAPRTLNKIVDGLEVDLSVFSDNQPTEDYASIHRAMRTVCQKVIVVST